MIDKPPGVNDRNLKQRREAMLRELVVAMNHHHARKRQRRTIGAAMALVAALCGVLLLALPGTAPPTNPQVVTGPSPVQGRPPEPPPRVDIKIVQTDRAVLQRYAASEPPRLVQYIDDDQLLATLEAIGRPTGLVRMADAVWLTNAVTDPSREDNDDARRQPPFPPL